MKIYFMDGRFFTLDISTDNIETIDECKSIMCPWLVKYLQDKYNVTYNYSLFCKEYNDKKDYKFEYYIPIDVNELFAIETETDPNYLHSVVKYKKKNHICRILLNYVKDVDKIDYNGYTPLYLACMNTNRFYMGSEINSETYELCMDRLTKLEGNQKWY